MSEMIERVAKAMAARQYANPWDHLMAHQRDHFCGLARAAIEAMRDPTDAMQQAVWEACFDNRYDGTQAPAAYAMCVAMIDAALT